ncbi:MAG: Na+/H+ antiporter NhaA [Betaproteobacteria bacterium]|nr:Na+/H+ antiporter NhaA [Betaproteobacteria bacterium]
MVGLIIWLCVLKSGIHATLAGVITALAIRFVGRQRGFPAQGGGARLASLGCVCRVAHVCLCQCRRLPARRQSGDPVSDGAARHCGRPGGRQGGGGVRGLLAADARGRCPLAGRRQHAPIPRRLRCCAGSGSP